ncbi:unnamed protein product, partial [Effrenium voratum]
VTPKFLGWLRQEPFVQEHFALSDAVGTTLQGSKLAYGVLLLLRRSSLRGGELRLWHLPSRMNRSLLVADLPLAQARLRLATVHLESDSRASRIAQLRQILQHLEKGDVTVLAGDMNFADGAPEEVLLRQAEFRDCTEKSGCTMPRSDADGRPARLDRVLAASGAGAWHLVPTRVELLGTEPIDRGEAASMPASSPAAARRGSSPSSEATDPEMPALIPLLPGEPALSRGPSDHYGVLCDFELVQRKAQKARLDPL